MAYQMKVDGMEEISAMLEKMDKEAAGIAAQALYDGAGVMAEEVRKGAAAIRTAPFKYAREGERLPSPEEKEIILNAGAGIAKFDESGTEINTSVGYKASGYAELNGKVKPVPLIVNAVNSGTSFMKKQPFIRKARNSGSPKAMNAMKAKITEAFEAMTKE